MMTLRLNKELYEKDSLQDAMNAYRELAKIEVQEQDFYWIIQFWQCRYEEKQTVAEFENYLIDRMNSR